MKVQFKDAKIPEALRSHVEGRLGLAFGRFAERIERVTVRISALGDDRRCRIDVGLRGRMIRVDVLNVDPFAAADDAISRAGSSISRAIEREAV